MAKSYVRKSAPRTEPRFTIATLEKLAADMKSGAVPLSRTVISDEIVTGLRAIVRNTGSISYHVQYHVGDARPWIALGDHPELTISDARNLARTIVALGDIGIDVTEGLHKRLMRELKRDGIKWRPK